MKKKVLKLVECPSCEGHGTTDWAYLAYNKCHTCNGTGEAPEGTEKATFSAILSATIKANKRQGR